MVKVKVLHIFRDKFDHVTVYQAGKTYEFDAERAEDLVSRGLAKLIKTIKK